MSLTLKKRNKIWYIRGTAAGREFYKSTGATERKIAERIKVDFEKKAWERRLDGPGANLTMAQVFAYYLEEGKPDRFIEELVKHWGDDLVADITPDSIRKAGKKIYPHANEPTWNRQVIAPTQAAINLSAGMGWCNRISVKKYTENPKKKTPADLEWVLAFCDQAIKDELPHLAALCLFMFGTAARIGEACRLTWHDFDLTAAKATIQLYKPTPWIRIAHLPPDVVAALANIPSNRNPGDRVFGYAGRGSVRDPWNNVCKRAGIERLTPHCCRHGFATSMLHMGIDPKTVAERGGWKDAATVLRTYAHALKDETITDQLFRAKSVQPEIEEDLTNGNKRRK
ncbi:tyrosine-type recombinase/integrase [Pseudaestuariivita rosea]|uniref:tyrosine-type recombinase/integrase n=1 Tax=Pseudaestuariivita rosea TaxID=2763263 RepID=UPI001ABB5838|nr:site-specific integrase [Pseudaestuariivita rosea]